MRRGFGTKRDNGGCSNKATLESRVGPAVHHVAGREDGVLNKLSLILRLYQGLSQKAQLTEQTGASMIALAIPAGLHDVYLYGCFRKSSYGDNCSFQEMDGLMIGFAGALHRAQTPATPTM